MPNISPSGLPAKPPKLPDQLKRCMRDKHYSLRTEEVYVYWARWFIRFHGLKHPPEMGASEVKDLLSRLANELEGKQRQLTVLQAR